MKSFLIVLLIVPSVLVAEDTGFPCHRLGTGIGFPQFASLTYQYSTSETISLEAYAGTILLGYSLGGRFIIGSNARGFHPRLFAGLALIEMLYQEYYDSPDGAEMYAWLGGGFTWAFSGQRLFFDFGYMGPGSSSRGLGEGMMTISAGLLFDL